MHPDCNSESELSRCAATTTEQAARSRFEREAAALDLADASQAATVSAMSSEHGATLQSLKLRTVARQLYESADRHRDVADQLDRPPCSYSSSSAHIHNDVPAERQA